jgi:hypothetical protein
LIHFRAIIPSLYKSPRFEGLRESTRIIRARFCQDRDTESQDAVMV